MFEITGDDIKNLGDVELRTLVARLAIAELLAHGQPISGVTAGGDQNAPDGGLDVRVELANADFAGDFVQRTPMGIQVKKPDMKPSAIATEMRPSDILRPVIGQLAHDEGSYIIVSSQGSVADKPLHDRRAAMADAVSDHPWGSRLHVDYYDRTRLATWANQYPGVSSWVRARVGRPLAGWQAMGDWSGIRVVGEGTFISDGTACLHDARSQNDRTLTLVEGVSSLREILREERQSVRLIGLSGLGKTRLIQALFESDVGSDPLDPSLAVYTDYSETPSPTAREMAAQLIEAGRRAILVVDNCKPDTHAALAKICGAHGSRLSLITIEYDVQDDLPEGTEVFRLSPGSEEGVETWLKGKFDHVSQLDRDRIAKFSGGNFRVAQVLAETIRKGDSLGNLRDRELFRRIFDQRNDPSDDLLEAAEILALVYSFDREDVADTGELFVLASMTGLTVGKLYAFVTKLKKRSIIQTRGRWAALLPHAIANRLAAQALERIPGRELDAFCARLPDRMKISFSRRLGFLHDVEEARAAVGRCLETDGPLGDLLAPTDAAAQILRNLAPVAPEATLKRIRAEIDGPRGVKLIAPRSTHRWQTIVLLKSLAYSPELFPSAAEALGAMVCAEAPGENDNSAREAFRELFHLKLSGTQADPKQRRDVARAFYERGGEEGIRCGHLALQGLLEASHFTSMSNFDFGAQSRDFGWLPPTYGDIWNWFIDALDLALEMAAIPAARPEIRKIVARSLRGILLRDACIEGVEKAARTFVADGEWLDGWKAVRSAIRFDSQNWKEPKRERISAIAEMLKPADPLNVARAYVIDGPGSGIDLLEFEVEDRNFAATTQRLNDRAQEIGREMADNPAMLGQFLQEVSQAENPMRAYYFGIGLAESKPLAEVWRRLVEAFKQAPEGQRNATLLGGFVWHAHRADPVQTVTFLDEALVDPVLSREFIYLQAQTGIDEQAIARLRKGLVLQTLAPVQFYQLSYGTTVSVGQPLLAEFLTELGSLPGGAEPALDIVRSEVAHLKWESIEVDEILLATGRALLPKLAFREMHSVGEHRVEEAIKQCFAGETSAAAAREFCAKLKAMVAAREVYASDLDGVFRAIFEVQPIAALDELILLPALADDDDFADNLRFRGQSPLEAFDENLLWSWLGVDPELRFKVIARFLNLFATSGMEDDTGLSPLFLEILERAPDRELFLQSLDGNLLPDGWSGHLSVILDRRALLLDPLKEHNDPAVARWAERTIAVLHDWASKERDRETAREEAFE